MKYLMIGFILPIFFILFVFSGFESIEGRLGRFDPYAQQFRPIRDVVCAGNATRNQLTGLIRCFDNFKSSLNKNANQNNAVVQNCLPEGDQDISFMVDPEQREFVYMKCSKRFVHCVHREMRRFRRPKPLPTNVVNGSDGTTVPTTGGPQTRLPGPGTENGRNPARETLLQCEKLVLNLQ